MEKRAAPQASKDGADVVASAHKPISRYVRDFESLFVPIRVELLRSKAQTGQLRHCQFRSLCWRYFLGCFPEDFKDWLPACEIKRQQYESIKRKNLGTAKLVSSNDDDKQDQETKVTIERQIDEQSKNTMVNIDDKNVPPSRFESVKQHNSTTSSSCDYKNVFRTIERDVVRTFPDMEFFRQTEMQDILCNILFNFASENQHLSYKQGMHELLATLLYVAHTDSQNCSINYEGDLANETIASLLSLKYLEHDVYHLFSSLMRSIETWYQNDEVLVIPEVETTTNQLENYNELLERSSQSTPSGSSSNWSSSKPRSKSIPTRHQVSSVLSIKLRKISENIVKSYDSELFNHLEALQIAPQIYGIRWMRLLFGREFEFLDLLMVWDAIICDQDSMSLIDYVFASMLITIREELVNGDYTHCLNNLMRHQFKNVPYVIKLALYLRDPVNHSRPKELSQYPAKYNTINPKNVSKNVRTSNRHNTLGDIILSAKNSIIKEYEMREMQTSTTSSISKNVKQGGNQNRFPMSRIGTSSSPNTFNVSSESYDDLHSIVDYCWRLLSEQIDSLQRCLPKEKGLHSEDEIFVALAQLKKVRDVLKGSLRLEDELESAALIIGGNKSKDVI